MLGKSLQLGTIAGIRLQAHWTFLLILAWVALSSIVAGSGLFPAAVRVAFVLLLFGCVLLHELGHALAARMFGISTRDITLLPIGGLARLEKMPRKPFQELVVALAGPAVNVVIAAVLFAILLVTGDLRGLTAMSFQDVGLPQQLLVVNVMLVVFNMLPAFPLDGGRVFRALLSMVVNYQTATRSAAVVGQVFAVGLAFLGFANPLLFLIAVFIFFGAAAEAKQVEIHTGLRDLQVRDGMLRSFRVVPATAIVRTVAQELLDYPQNDYPVIADGILVGMLRRTDLLAALDRDMSATVADIMHSEVQPVEESAALMPTLEQVSSRGGQTLPVTHAGELTGLLDLQQVFDLAKARDRLRRAASFVPTLVSQRPAAAHHAIAQLNLQEKNDRVRDCLNMWQDIGAAGVFR